MEWQCFQYSDECANTYVMMHEDHAIVFDPSKNSSHLLDFLKKRKMTLDAIFLTHGHFDHIGGVKILTQHYHCPIYVGEEELALLRDPYKNVSIHFHHPMTIEEEITPLYDGQVLCIHDMEIQVITTPFHTRGSACYYLPQLHKMVSGDTLFKGVLDEVIYQQEMRIKWLIVLINWFNLLRYILNKSSFIQDMEKKRP